MGVAGALSLAATGLSAFGKYDSTEQQAQSQAEMDEFRAQQLQNQAEYGRAQANQTDAFLRGQLMRQIATQGAINASANIDPSSPTALAIGARTQGQGDQQRAIKVGDILAQASEDQTESGMYTQAAQRTLNDAQGGGILGLLGSGLSALSGLKFS